MRDRLDFNGKYNNYINCGNMKMLLKTFLVMSVAASIVFMASCGSDSGVSVKKKPAINGSTYIIVIARSDSVVVKDLKPYGSDCNMHMKNLDDNIPRGESKEYFVMCNPNEVDIITNRGSSTFSW